MGRGRDINEALSRSIGSTWRTEQGQYFERIDVFPSGKEDRVVGYFKQSHYPPEIANPRIELRVRLNGDMNLTYIEEWSGEDWRCRWDRHENPHNDYEHFHIPPTISQDDAVDAAYNDPPFGVIQIAFSFIEDRVGDLWEEETTYPSSYQFHWEYGPDIRI